MALQLDAVPMSLMTAMTPPWACMTMGPANIFPANVRQVPSPGTYRHHRPLINFLQPVFVGRPPTSVAGPLHKQHRGAEAPDPTNQGPAHQAKKLARRISDGNQQQRAPIRHPHIDAIAALPCDSYREAQDVLLTLFAYEVGQRVGAIAQVAVEDVEPLQDGGARVRFWRHKTTDNNTAIFKVISPGLHRLLRTWLQDANITEGPVFRPLPGQHNHLKNRPDTAISPRAIASAMKRCMTRIGIGDVQKIGGHSTCIGGALDIAETGGDSLSLMRYGNWKSTAMPLRYTQRLTDAVNPIHQVERPAKDDQ